MAFENLILAPTQGNFSNSMGHIGFLIFMVFVIFCFYWSYIRPRLCKNLYNELKQYKGTKISHLTNDPEPDIIESSVCKTNSYMLL